MDVEFPFENVGKGYFGYIRRPIAKVSFKCRMQDLWIDTWMVVDTGADFSILPRYLSEDLGISPEHDCIKDVTAGVGGQQTVFLCKSKVEALIGSLKRKVPLAFLDSNEVPALLGRLGFLETFDTEFLKMHAVIFRD